jgi:hypothetical protein
VVHARYPAVRGARAGRALRGSAILLVVAFLIASFPRVQAVSGVVRDIEGTPLTGAVVRVKATQTSTLTDAAGRFSLEGFSPALRVRVTAWRDGHHIGGADAWPWNSALDLVLSPHPQVDETEYAWQPPAVAGRSALANWVTQRSLDLTAAVSVDGLFKPVSDRLELGCRDCHASIYRDWGESAHALGPTNERFMTMYNGTNVHGEQSPPTRFATNREYGRVPMSPDPSQTYYGPGFKLDFPDIAGNCATCHLPTLVAEDTPYADPNQSFGVHEQGTHCDFCHKTSAVVLNPQTGSPYPNRSGILGVELMRSTEPGLFFGPYDDVDFGRDTYSPLFAQSAACASCHSASFWGVPIYQSFDEWQTSPYAAEGTTCQKCHMAPDGITTNIAPHRGGVERDPRTISTHRFPGASDDALLQGAAELNVVVLRDDARLLVEVSVTNSGAGHHLPTGSPLRQMLLVVSATDERGRVLPLEEGATLPAWAGDLAGTPGAYFAKLLEQLWTGQMPTAAYWTPTRIAEDSRLPARATRTSHYTYAASGSGKVTVDARLILRRAYDELAEQKGWPSADVLMAQEVVSLSGVSPSSAGS